MNQPPIAPIIDTQDMAEAAGFDEDAWPQSDMAATAESDPEAQIEFHVQMRSWTIREMEALIVEAAAAQMIRGFGEKKFAKIIEDRAIAQVTAKADVQIDRISAEIIDQPLTPAFGAKAPVTMREFIGLYAKEYLTQTVDQDGKPSTGGWGGKTAPRIEQIVSRLMDRKFKAEIEKATNAAVAEIQRETKAVHEALIAAEKSRLREALAKITA